MEALIAGKQQYWPPLLVGVCLEQPERVRRHPYMVRVVILTLVVIWTSSRPPLHCSQRVGGVALSVLDRARLERNDRNQCPTFRLCHARAASQESILDFYIVVVVMHSRIRTKSNWTACRRMTWSPLIDVEGVLCLHRDKALLSQTATSSWGFCRAVGWAMLAGSRLRSSRQTAIPWTPLSENSYEAGWRQTWKEFRRTGPDPFLCRASGPQGGRNRHHPRM